MVDRAVVLRGASDLRLVRAARLHRVEADVAAGRDVGRGGRDLARQVGQVTSCQDVQFSRCRDQCDVRQRRVAAAVRTEVVGLLDDQRFVFDVAFRVEHHVAAADDVLAGDQHRAAIAAYYWDNMVLFADAHLIRPLRRLK